MRPPFPSMPMAPGWPAAPVVSLGVLAAAVFGAAWSSVARFPTCLWLLLTAIAPPVTTGQDRQPELGGPGPQTWRRDHRPEPVGAGRTVGERV
jgi:hypothetical protein